MEAERKYNINNQKQNKSKKGKKKHRDPESPKLCVTEQNQKYT